MMNILYCGDEGVGRGILLSAISLCRHTDDGLNFYILTASAKNSRGAIKKSFAERMRKSIACEGKERNVFLFDISERFASQLPTANLNTRFTPMCMLRLFADTVPEIPDKILYLDTDVLCRANFDELYGMDIGDAEIAGVPDRYGKWFFGNIFRHDYLNSGVLLMNMAKIRESGLFEKCRALCAKKKMFMPDQTALNNLAVKTKLPAKYNEQGKIKSETVLKHFTTFFRIFPFIHMVTVKPWNADRLYTELRIFEFDYLFEECKE